MSPTFAVYLTLFVVLASEVIWYTWMRVHLLDWQFKTSQTPDVISNDIIVKRFCTKVFATGVSSTHRSMFWFHGSLWLSTFVFCSSKVGIVINFIFDLHLQLPSPIIPVPLLLLIPLHLDLFSLIHMLVLSRLTNSTRNQCLQIKLRYLFCSNCYLLLALKGEELILEEEGIAFELDGAEDLDYGRRSWSTGSAGTCWILWNSSHSLRL